MAGIENPFAEDGTFRAGTALSGDDDDDDVVESSESESAVRKTKTIDAFLGAVNEFLTAANERFYTRRIKMNKRPDDRIHSRYIKFKKEVFDKPDAIRHSLGQLAIEGFHEVMSPHYDAIAAGDTEVVPKIDHELLVKSGMRDRWLRAGPNVKRLFMTHMQSMVRFSNIYYLNLSVDENIGRAAVDKFKNSNVMSNVMETMTGMMSKFSESERQGLIDFVRDPNVLKSAVTALLSGDVDLSAMGGGGGPV